MVRSLLHCAAINMHNYDRVPTLDNARLTGRNRRTFSHTTKSQKASLDISLRSLIMAYRVNLYMYGILQLSSCAKSQSIYRSGTHEEVIIYFYGVLQPCDNFFVPSRIIVREKNIIN